ncbi:MAG: O-antigen ligase family protein [Pseudomonadota bacterium]
MTLQLHIVALFASLTLAASLIFGGSTRAGFLSDAILQFIAVPTLIITCLYVRQARLPAATWRALALACAIVLIPFVQLIPLPPSVWTLLPGRDLTIATFETSGQPLPWLSLSLAPAETWVAALSLIVPLTLFAAAAALPRFERRALSLGILAFACASAFLGLLQVAQGPTSAFRFFSYTNTSEAVGFFANRNHLAALIYCGLALTGAWLIASCGGAVDAEPAQDGKAATSAWSSARVMVVLALAVAIFTLIGAQAIARSRAGLMLTGFVIAGLVLLAFWGSRRRPGKATRITLARQLGTGVGVIGLLAIAQVVFLRIQERFSAGVSDTTRQTFNQNTFEAALAFAPFGSGVSSFASVYGAFEASEDLLLGRYANHAHNDLLQIALETGVLGLLALLAFVLWYGARLIAVWRMPQRTHDVLVARAASLAILALIAHGLVDYPLRTAAMMALFAVLCALMLPPPLDDAAQPAVADDANGVKPFDLDVMAAALAGTGQPGTAGAAQQHAGQTAVDYASASWSGPTATAPARATASSTHDPAASPVWGAAGQVGPMTAAETPLGAASGTPWPGASAQDAPAPAPMQHAPVQGAASAPPPPEPTLRGARPAIAWPTASTQGTPAPHGNGEPGASQTAAPPPPNAGTADNEAPAGTEQPQEAFDPWAALTPQRTTPTQPTPAPGDRATQRDDDPEAIWPEAWRKR